MELKFISEYNALSVRAVDQFALCHPKGAPIISSSAVGATPHGAI
jgi:hypothetical protein